MVRGGRVTKRTTPRKFGYGGGTGGMKNRGCGRAGGAPCGGTQARRGGLMQSGGGTGGGTNSFCGTLSGNFPDCAHNGCHWNYDDNSCH